MRIVKNGDVHVSAPFGLPKSEVERFIEEHREWIAEARKKTCESQKQRADFYHQLPLKTKEQAERRPPTIESPHRADGRTPFQGDWRETTLCLLQGDDFAMGRLQCQGQVHLLLGLSSVVARMVCRARRGS